VIPALAFHASDGLPLDLLYMALLVTDNESSGYGSIDSYRV
jgi:hypothetical protein